MINPDEKRHFRIHFLIYGYQCWECFKTGLPEHGHQEGRLVPADSHPVFESSGNIVGSHPRIGGFRRHPQITDLLGYKEKEGLELFAGVFEIPGQFFNFVSYRSVRLEMWFTYLREPAGKSFPVRQGTDQQTRLDGAEGGHIGFGEEGRDIFPFPTVAEKTIIQAPAFGNNRPLYLIFDNHTPQGQLFRAAYLYYVGKNRN